MGARTQVLVKQGKEQVYLYSHWGSGSILKTVKTALSKRWRWNDMEYLARIIFCEMVKDDINGEVGYGIGASQHGDLDNLVTVDVSKQTVSFQDMFSGSVFQGMSFEGFCGTNEDDIEKVELKNEDTNA